LQLDAQDVGFSQFFNQPLLRNPALAGLFDGDYRLTASYRNQWQSVTVPYRTFAQSTEVKFPFSDNFTLTAALQLTNDIAGTSQFSTTQILPAANGSLRVGDSSFLSVGIMWGYLQQKFNPQTLILNDQFVGGQNGSFTILPYSSQTFTNTSVRYTDLSTGVSYKSTINDNTDFYIGLSLFHAFQPTVGFYQGEKVTLNRRIGLNTGLSIPLSDYEELTLYGDYFGEYNERFKYTGSNILQAGVLYRYDLSDDNSGRFNITGGLLYRLDDALIPVVLLGYDNFNAGLSYDVNINRLVVASQYRGGLELSLSYRGFIRSRNSELRAVKCRGL
jgi:type IX secretion system PorP/SprF family membrane protein